MKVSQVLNYYLDYHKMNSKKNTARNQEFTLSRFQSQFSSRELEFIIYVHDWSLSINLKCDNDHLSFNIDMRIKRSYISKFDLNAVFVVIEIPDSGNIVGI